MPDIILWNTQLARSIRTKATASKVTRQTPARTSTKSPSVKPANASAVRWRGLVLLVAEILLLLTALLIGIISVLGRAAQWFGGTGLARSLLPFAGTVLLLGIGLSLLLWLWVRLRRRLASTGKRRPVMVAALIAVASLALASRISYQSDLTNFRSLVGGVEQAGKASISHQVYAAYRRADLGQMQKILDRARPYLPIIRAAARANDLDQDLLAGIGAIESSFVPRDSNDGGRGLYQITSTPAAAIAAVNRQLHVDRPDPRNHRQNIYLAAATLRHYLDQFHGDLFLGLLAYNIGPRNGGLQSIMSQYGARDFFTIQPYLQHLPRDYPIRVLTAALAFRLWREEGGLPDYAEGQNARAIQAIGIPGLDLKIEEAARK